MRMKKHLQRALRHHYYYFNVTGGGFVPSEIDTLIGRHFPDSPTLGYWNLPPVLDYDN